MIYNSPLKVLATKVKTWVLNLNQYRNTYFRTLNTLKINYKLMMESQIKAGPTYNKIACIYTIYPKDKRPFDIGNVCCVHQKFFEDALVEYGKLPDDNYKYLPLVIYKFGEIDKDNPRVEVEVINYTKEGLDKIIEMLYNIKQEL
jgi:hypothetical protein